MQGHPRKVLIQLLLELIVVDSVNLFMDLGLDMLLDRIIKAHGLLLLAVSLGDKIKVSLELLLEVMRDNQHKGKEV